MSLELLKSKTEDLTGFTWRLPIGLQRMEYNLLNHGAAETCQVS